MRMILTCLSVLALLMSPEPAFGERTIVAVFDLEDRTARLDKKALAQLSDYLAAQMTAQGFRVVPRAQLKARLTAQRSASYKTCVDEKCQIEIGRELAAQKSLATHIVQVGSKCAVVATLYDLRSSASEKAATHKSACDTDALVTALERVVARLGAQKAPAGSPPAVRAPIKNPPRQIEGTRPIATKPDPIAEGGGVAPVPVHRKWWFWAIVGVGVSAITTAIIIGTMGSGSDETTPRQTALGSGSGLGFSF